MNSKALPISILIFSILTFFPNVGLGQNSPKSSGNILFEDSDNDMDLGEGPSKGITSSDAEDKALKLRKLVQSATKGETTVQEAPAVITIMTEDDIHDYGFRNFINLMSFIPGILPANAQYNAMPLITVNGNSQGILLVQDGISLFDPLFNVQASIRRWPLEIVKRVEVMSSPGGVLWGANSFMGIASIITKNADDVDGFQLGLGGGSGPGDQDVFRAYGMFGKSYGKFKIFAHMSGEFFRGPKYQYYPLRFISPPPQPMGVTSYSAYEEMSSSVPMSFYGSLNGKINYDKFTLIWKLPFIGFPGFSRNYSVPASVTSLPSNLSAPVPALRQNNINYLDRMVAFKYKDQSDDGKFGIGAVGYFTQLQRDMVPWQAIPFTPGVSNGIAFDAKSTAYRSGLTLDFNYNFSKHTRVLVGGETFYSWVKGSTTYLIAPLNSSGDQIDFAAIPNTCPYNGSPNYDPLDPSNTTYAPGCRQPMIADQDRLVIGTFASLQHKFSSNIIIDGGLRFQAAPAGNAGYSPQLIPSASLVVPLTKNYFWKVNYLRGFRPPVFNNTGSSGMALNYAGDPSIKVEKSQAVQTEVNGILIKNKGKIQELSFRLNFGYTLLDNFIRINQGQYFNGSRRTIYSVEGLARLYLRGGHSFYMGYSMNQNYAGGFDDGMIYRSVPNQWFSFASVFKISKKLDLIASLKIIGAYEDPNKVVNPDTNSAKASWVAYELVPSAGILSAGFRYKTKIGGRKAEFSLMTYNLTDTRSYYTADYFNDLAATTESVPTKGQRFYFFANSKFYF